MSNFIGSWFLTDTSVCDRLIQYHESNPNKSMVNVTYKTCEETYINLNDLPQCVDNYVRQLETVVNMYKEKYVFCNQGPYWAITEGIKIQKYDRYQAYHGWHFERDAAGDKEVRRHLAFMTYLNNVNDAGETEFYYYGEKFKPQKGLTLIWPAEWTHTHRGVPSPETKYIITGWYNYY
jgi:hypothetical protein